MIFTTKTTLAEVLEFPIAEDVLLKHNVPCLGCPMAKMEMQEITIGQICATYGINEQDLLADLNASIETYKDKNKK